MLELRYHAKFKKDFKTVVKRGCNPQLLADVIDLLCNEQPLPPKYKDHNLIGDYVGCRECHITPDWLLVYKVERNTLTLILLRTGSHSDLF